MASVFDYQQNKWINIDDASVTNAVASGQYQFPAEVVIPVFNPEGKPVGISGAEATNAFRNGYTYRQRGQTNEYLRQQYENDMIQGMQTPVNQAATFASGLARSMSFGASDVIARAIGGADAAEAMRYAEIANPGMALAGEITGAFAPLGAANLVGNAALRVGTRAAQSASALRAGSALTKTAQSLGLSKLIGTAAQQGLQQAGRLGILQTGIKYGAAGMVEGAAQGMQQTISDFALSKPEASIETAIANVGLGAVTGGALGYGLGTVGKASAKFAKAASDWNKQKGMGKAVREFLKSSYPPLYKMFTRLDGEQKVVFEEVFRNEKRARAIARVQDNPGQAIDELMNQAEAMRTAVPKIQAFVGKQRQALVKKLDAGVADPQVVSKRWNRLETRLGKAIENIEKYPKLSGGKYTPQMKEALQKLADDFSNAVTPSEQHNAIRGVLTDLNDIIGTAKKGISDATRKDVSNLMKFRQEINKFSTNPDIWGKGVKRYESTNALWSKFIEANDSLFGFKGKLTKKVNGKVILDKEKIERALTASARTKGQSIVEEIKIFEDSATALMQHITSGKVAQSAIGTRAQQALSILQNAKSFADEAFAIKQMSILFNRQQSQTGRVLQGVATGGTVGALGGPVGSAILGLGGAALSNPSFMMRYVHGIGQGEQFVTNRVGSAISGWLNRGRTAQRLSSSALSGTGASLFKAAKAFGGEKERGESDLDFFSRTMTSYSQRPMKTEAQMRPALFGMNGAMPEAYAATLNTMQRAAEFLSSKAPNLDIDVSQTKTELQAMSQMQKLEAYAEAVMRPMVLVSQLEQGTIKRETVEAVQAVYPQFYSGLQGMIADRIADDSKKLNYYQKLELATLFNLPATKALQPATIASLQETLNQIRTQNAEKQRTSSRAPRSATNEMSGSTALQYRRQS